MKERISKFTSNILMTSIAIFAIILTSIPFIAITVGIADYF